MLSPLSRTGGSLSAICFQSFPVLLYAGVQTQTLVTRCFFSHFRYRDRLAGDIALFVLAWPITSTGLGTHQELHVERWYRFSSTQPYIPGLSQSHAFPVRPPTSPRLPSFVPRPKRERPFLHSFSPFFFLFYFFETDIESLEQKMSTCVTYPWKLSHDQ